MNILFLTYQGNVAGSTFSIAYLARGLADKGHKIVVGCRQNTRLFLLLKDSNVILEPMSFRGKFDLQNIRQIKDAVRKHKIQIINSQSSIDRYTSIFSNWLYGLKVPVIHTRRQTPRSAGGFIQNLFYRKGTRKIVVNSDQLKQSFVKKGIPEEHLKVIYNGIPPDFYAGADPQKIPRLKLKYSINEKDIIIGCVSRRKKQEQLLEALTYFPEHVKVMLIGVKADGFKPLTDKLGISERVIYAGKINYFELASYYLLFSVFVLPSTTEGFGLVLVEAMGLGIPVIGTRAEGIINVLDEQKNGLWFEDGNIPELVEKINMILSHRSKRDELIQNGKKAAYSRFTIKNTVDNYEKFFTEILE